MHYTVAAELRISSNLINKLASIKTLINEHIPTRSTVCTCTLGHTLTWMISQ